ncbi:MAG: metallophosphoesterase [Candidatus Aenigmatarchaeota archaeon]
MKFLKERPALLLDEFEQKTLVLADLHLGLEYEIYKKGISVPPRMDEQKGRIFKAVNETGAKRLFLLGDVKHNVPTISVSEKERLPEFFEELCERVEVKIVKGNHDGNIEELTEGSRVEMASTSGFKEGDFYFNHGQSWPEKEIIESRTLIRGHSHPAVEFKDKLGFSSVMSCWIRGPVNREALSERYDVDEEEIRLEEVLIVPAFNQLISGMPMNREKEKSMLGPVLENEILDLDESKAYLLDGTFIGKLEDL